MNGIYEMFGHSRKKWGFFFIHQDTDWIRKAIGKLRRRDHQAVAITDDLVSNRGPNPLRSGIISPLEEAPTQPATLYEM